MVNVNLRSRQRRLAAARTVIHALWDAAQRTLSNPISLALAVFAISYYFMEVVGKDTKGPLEKIANITDTALLDEKINSVEKTLLSVIKSVFAFLIRYKVKFGILTAYSVSYTLRPNTVNTIVCGALTILTLCTSTISVQSHYLFALIFWMYTQVNTAKHRSYIATAGLITLLVYFEVITLSHAVELGDDPNASSVHATPAPVVPTKFKYHKGPPTGSARPIYTPPAGSLGGTVSNSTLGGY